ncbi:holin [Clostridium sp. JS66]|uniref:holin n=1 Tax=Clostridium sp. JS66 TaxID=3064705 RepID=UPI00298E6814|nr:holin [Clostridium sp. JS66]WPC44651.1 holin [Clostridium sp. JS66]
MNNNRFKNYGLWVSIAAFIPLLLNSFGIDVLPKNYSDVVNALLAILVTAGILNNPQTESKGYLDDKKTEENKDSK